MNQAAQEYGIVKQSWWFIAAAVWAALAGLGMVAVARSERAVRSHLPAESAWPDATPIVRTSGRAMLVIGVHPRCPCTGATLAAVHELVRTEPDRFEVVCVATHPADEVNGWVQAENVARAGQIPGARVFLDPEGSIAERHGLHTSGQVRLYGSGGGVIFDGGLTPGRGMVADARVVATLLDPARSTPDRTETFGCPLVGPEGGRP